MLFNFLQRTAPIFATAPQSKARSVRAIAGDVEDPWFDKYVLTRYTSLSNANADTSGTVVDDGDTINLVDNEDLISGTQYWYRLSYLDVYGNMSAKSSPPSSITYRGATTDDVEDKAITPRKANLGNPLNSLKDNQLIDPTLWEISGGTGPAISPQPNDAGAFGASANFFRLTSSLAVGQSITFKSLPVNPCVPDTLLSFSCYLRRYLPASTFSVTLSVEWYTLDAGGEPIFLSNSAGSKTISLVSGSTIYLAKFTEIVPAGAVFYALKLVTAAAASATTYGFDFGGPMAIQAQYSVVEKTNTLTSITIAASSTAVILTHVSNHTTLATQVLLAFRFMHSSAAARNLSININKNGVKIWETGTIRLDINEPFSFNYLDDAISGSSSTYEILILAAGNAVDVDARMIISDARFG